MEKDSRSDVNGFFDWNEVDVIKSSLLFDQKPDVGLKVTMQAPHIDYSLTPDPLCNLWVTISAITSTMRLFVWPRSHTLIMTLAKEHGWPGFEKSTEILDAEFADKFGYKDLKHPYLVTIHPGQTIIFNGMLVHAGAPGVTDADGITVPSYR
jgi:ectoine hydroxylase-related dioxygenase (phytanoyl-CoA dioxygenase family)